MYAHNLIRKFLQLAALAAILGIAACSGDDLTGTPSTGDTTTGDGTTGGDGTTINTVVINSISAEANTLSAGGSTRITVELVDETGAAATSSNIVTFSSDCVTIDGTAFFSNATPLATDGKAITTYTADGCVGTDPVLATLSDTGQTAFINITIASATVGLIEHTSNDPSLIALAGTGTALGLPETSVVTFTVKDGLGQPIQGKDVIFSLNSYTGGITLSDTTVTSDSAGLVSTTVQSGTISTNVRVTATLDGDTGIQTVSGTIAIATGPPAQNSMSIGATELNPLAWNKFNKTVAISVLLGDRFSNLISDGTIVSFRTELGTIDPYCRTTNGGCSVNWHSGSPQINNLPPADDDYPGPGEPGRTTILAFVEGEESFVDLDFDGVFSDGDGFIGMGFNLEEAFVDANGDGEFTVGEDNIDFDSSNDHNDITKEEERYNGKGCTYEGLCDLVDAINIWRNIELVVAEATPDIFAVYIGGILQGAYPATHNVADGKISFTIGGAENQQVLPVGSTVKFSVDNGKIIGSASQTVLNSNGGAGTYGVFIATDGTSSADGYLSVEAIVGGVTYSFAPIAIQD